MKQFPIVVSVNTQNMISLRQNSVEVYIDPLEAHIIVDRIVECAAALRKPSIGVSADTPGSARIAAKILGVDVQKKR